jgi:hypothetical protein
MMPQQRGQRGSAGFHVREPIRQRRQIFAIQKVARTTDQKRHSDNAAHIKSSTLGPLGQPSAGKPDAA